MGEERFGNYSSCCRLCLSDKFNYLKPIFEDEAEGTTLAQRILNFIGVEILQNDKISTMICNQCRARVNNWESYKSDCMKNQTKLHEWLSSWSTTTGDNNISNMTIQVKDEPVDCDESADIPQLEDASEDQVTTIKPEPSDDVVEEYYEQPPQLTPHNQDSRSQDFEDQPMMMVNGHGEGFVGSKSTNSKQCTICYKLFSTSGNRMKHERIIHGTGSGKLPVITNNASASQDDNSQQSIESFVSSTLNTDDSIIDSENESRNSNLQKIQFAAGLRLKQKSQGSSTPSTIEGPLTPIELAYIERSKALLSMLHKFRCACHNVSFPTVKRLFAHLRMSYTWFPIFTCYNCVITFSTRSLNMRHTGRCPRPYLENSMRLAEMRRRSETKIRLYQYTKCVRCENLYSFYEDYCEHIDKDHSQDPPFTCLCMRKFDIVDEFRQHAYNSCYLTYYCDVCYSVFESLDDFRIHCEDEHDKIEEYSFVTPNPTFTLVDREEIAASRKRTHDEMQNDSATVTEANGDLAEIKQEDGNDRKKFIPSKPYNEPTSCDMCDRRFSNYYSLRKHMKLHRRSSIANGWKSKPSTCDKCGKVFSTYYNMIRHYKVHDDTEKHLQCALCSEKFRLVSELKDHLILVHGRANVCQECGRQFESVKELEQHRSVHLNIKVYRDSKTQSYRTGTKPRYTCDLCENVFDTDAELNDHIETMHNGMSSDDKKAAVEDNPSQEDFGRFSCMDCDRHYVSYKGLWLHNRRHHPERKPTPQTFECQYCDRVLQTNAAYQMHKQMHERMQERMQRQSSLSSHIKKNEDEEESYFTCKHCFKVFSNKYNLKTHLKTHGIYVSPGRTYSKSGKFVKTFWCDVCHQACQGYAELQKHKHEHIKEKLKDSHSRQQASHHQSAQSHQLQIIDVEGDEDIKPQIFNCDICTKGFLTKTQLMSHKATHDQESRGNQKRNFVYCKYCKIPFLNVESLNKHMEDEHNELKAQKPKSITKKHACNICKKAFDTAGALCSHQGWHKRGKSDKMLKAERAAQPINVKHECASCNLTFSTDTALQIHILEAHRNVNTHLLPSRCTICNIEFKTQASYDEHARLHRTASTAFQCKYCSKRFNKSETFNIHVNEVHPEFADCKFKCHQCDRVFEKQNALTIHLKVHDRQRLTGAPIKQPKSHVYTCSICHLGFEIPKDLRNHIITSHPF
ncbi:hypothetical protein Trydic_g10486 [Trypoxylus dichotomus]